MVLQFVRLADDLVIKPSLIFAEKLIKKLIYPSTILLGALRKGEGGGETKADKTISSLLYLNKL